MGRVSIIGALLLLCSVSFAEVEYPGPEEECPRPGAMFVGDSITTGSYPEHLHDEVVQFCDGWDAPFGYGKLAESGASIARVHELFDYLLMKEGEFLLSHIVVYGGLNDCLRGSRSRRIIDYLEHMIETSNGVGIKPVVLNIHVDSRCSRAVNHWLDGAQWWMDFQLVDTTFLRGEKGMIGGDGIHLTPAGNEALGEAAYRQVEWSCW